MSTAVMLLLLAQPAFPPSPIPVLEPGRIDTVAGTGKKGYSGDGGHALKAELNQPFHCELDGKGHLFVAEDKNHCVRRIDLKTGTITTVAGCGKKGYTGDGGPATAATFNEVYAIAIDADDNLYLVDRLNAVVRKVDARTGRISTVAGTGKKGYGGDGGSGNKALLREPNDCCLDGKGGLLIADVGDWRIRRLDLKTGMITTFAGTGRPAKAGKGYARAKVGDGGKATEAVLVGARAVCIDGKGNTYICEREGSTIRKVDAAGIITTLAGDGTWGEAGDGGPARKAVFRGPKGIRCDAAGNLYVVDCENHSVRKIEVATGTIRTVAGGRRGPGGDGGPATAAGLARPHGCILDGAGTLYIADSENFRVRRVRQEK